MSAKSDKIESDIDEIFDTAWDTRDGQVVPTTQDISLSDGAVFLDATYVYADMADSTGLAQTATQKQTGKIIRAYLNAASRLLKDNGGEIRGFDGDRVLAIFIGTNKNSQAAKAALQINWAVGQSIRETIKVKWPDLDWTLKHRVGVDTGKAMLVRGGVRGSNDIVSVGGAPNIAAKLSGLKTGPATFITHEVYSALHKSSKFGGTNGDKSMWADAGNVTFGGKKIEIWSSTWYWKPS
jgi:adenylate cyclase